MYSSWGWNWSVGSGILGDRIVWWHLHLVMRWYYNQLVLWSLYCLLTRVGEVLRTVNRCYLNTIKYSVSVLQSEMNLIREKERNVMDAVKWYLDTKLAKLHVWFGNEWLNLFNKSAKKIHKLISWVIVIYDSFIYWIIQKSSWLTHWTALTYWSEH